jgi:hypothetical protein
MASNNILVPNFWKVGADGDKALREKDLGWPDVLMQDALSDQSETIFRYVIVESGFNLLFYWVKDGQFYVIETEKTPIEVRRLSPNPHWDGQCELFKAGSEHGPNTSSPGEVIALFDDASNIWDSLVIDGAPISTVLSQSAIITWD